MEICAYFDRDDAVELLCDLHRQGFDAVVFDPNSTPPLPVGARSRDLSVESALTWCFIDFFEGEPSDAAIEMLLQFAKQCC